MNVRPSQILRRLALALVGLSFVGCALKAPPDVVYQSARPFEAGLSDKPQGDGAVADSNVADTQGLGGGFGDASTPLVCHLTNSAMTRTMIVTAESMKTSRSSVHPVF